MGRWTSFLNTTQIKNDYSQRPAGLEWRSNTLFILVTIAIGIFTDLFLYGLIVPVLPFLLEDRIGIPETQIQTYTSVLLAVFAGSSVLFSPIAGVIADRVSSRQSPFLIGLGILICATVILFLGETIQVLVLARVLQGMSSACVWVVGLALCIETVGPENLGKAIGTMFSFISVGSLWGPFLGGLLYKKTGYGGVLALALGILGVDFIMRVLVIEKKVARRYEPEEPAADANAADSSDRPLDNHPEQDMNDEEQPLLNGRKDDDYAFKLSEDQPAIARIFRILPCLSNPSLLLALLLAFVQAVQLGSLDATVTIVSRELFGFDSLKAGLMFLPLGILDFVFGPIAGWAVDRFGTKPVAVLSNAALFPVFILLRLPHAGGVKQIILYGGLLGLTGIGLSGTGAPSIVEAGIVVDKYHKANPKFFGENGPYAQLYGMSNVAYNLGLTVGPELAGELKRAIGYGNMNAVIAAITAVTAILCFFFLGGKPKMLQRKQV